MLSTCIFNVPKTYNDGSPVTPDTFMEVLDELRRFGGWTIGHATGMWEGQAEDSWVIEVDVPPERIQELRTIVEAIGEKLGQEAMRFVVLPPTTEHIQIQKKKDTGA